jgi:2-polyprenyl-3-methyl-5-hydroxy-6-metoxy-1,4-benzoquinol methylase
MGLSSRLIRTAVGGSVLLLIALSTYWSFTVDKETKGKQKFREASVSSTLNYIASPLGIPPGEAEALPSIRVEEPSQEVKRGIYGGKGDKAHLGGFTAYDGQGVSPAVWKHMITDYGVKSLMDVGCGKGISTLWFALHGVKVLCIEGSHDAVDKTLLPDPVSQVVEHDFSLGPYWPGKTYDALWCVEFLEHVGRNYQYNYIQAFRKAALIFVSHSIWGGW